MADQAVTAEVTDDPSTVGGTTGRRRAAFGGMKFLQLFRRHLTLPKLFAILPTVAENFQFAGIQRRQEDAILPNHRRRNPAGRGNFPELVGARSEFGRWPGGCRDARAIGPAELRPPF